MGRSKRRNERWLAGLMYCCIAMSFGLVSVHGSQHELLRADGTTLKGTVQCKNGSWTVGKNKLLAGEVIAVRFSQVPAPEHVTSGVCVRGGTLLVGTLESIRKGQGKIKAESFGKSITSIKLDQLAGAFFPLLSGQSENMPSVGNYALLRAGMLGGDMGEDSGESSLIQPGRRDRVTQHNLDVVIGKILLMRSTRALVGVPDGKDRDVSRTSIRAIEFKLAPMASADKGIKGPGPEMAVRLKAGDVVVGYVQSLDSRVLKLSTHFAGVLEIPVSNLASLFPSGRKGGKNGKVRWVSSMKPVSNKHIPTFDAEFPARANRSCDGNGIQIGGIYCDTGLGVHARSELVYKLDGRPGKRFVAWVGLDDETNGRGLAQARVLVNGKQVWASEQLKPNAKPVVVSVPLGAAKKLELQVTYGPDGDDSGDHVDWGWAAIVGK